MDTLPIELVTIIAVDSFELFTTLLRVSTIGNRLCEQYPQLVAKEKFIRMNVISLQGYIRSYLNGMEHSFNDQPAIEYPNIDKSWYRYGNRHRGNDLPAFISKNGYKSWHWNGKRHRDNNLPAIECPNGHKEWYIHGVRYFIKQ